MQKFVSENPQFKERIVQKMKENHFMQFIGFEPENIEEGFVSGVLKTVLHHKQQNGFLHGGVIATLADLVAGFASFSLVSADQTVVTSDLKIAYLNPGIGDIFYATGYVIKAGRMLHFAEAEIYYMKDNQKILVAKGYLTFAVIQVP